MINDKYVHGLDNETKRRLTVINTELEYINRESKKKYALNDPDELLKLKKDYDLYSKEFDLLTQLSDFYSENV